MNVASFPHSVQLSCQPFDLLGMLCNINELSTTNQTHKKIIHMAGNHWRRDGNLIIQTFVIALRENEVLYFSFPFVISLLLKFSHFFINRNRLGVGSNCLNSSKVNHFKSLLSSEITNSFCGVVNIK